MDNRASDIRISACIVTHNSAGVVADAIDSLLRRTAGAALSLYLCDNASGDGTVALVRRRFPQVSVLESPVNEGFGRGHNRVLPLLDSDYHAVINPDILLREDTLTILAAYMEAHPEVAICTPMILNEEGGRQYLPQRAPRLRYLLAGRLERFSSRFARLRDEYTRRREPADTPRDIEFATGCFMLLRTSAFVKLGGFDPRFFLYMEDADLSRRALALGRVVFYPGTAVIHRWARESHRSMRFLCLHLRSAAQYFKKWRDGDA
jgi:GT2 family glycosyltransferase